MKSSDQSASPLLAACLSSLGVVYGDIGTSPLYALRECFHGAHGIALTPDNVLGVLSLMWDPLESTCRHASLSIL